MKSLRVHSKVWLEVDGEPFLGDGRCRLLCANALLAVPCDVEKFEAGEMVEVQLLGNAP